ncbi:MAG TPA: hypothetical protein ENJ09_10940 [Planctomycetes bacterium]|nr:hypothetical protein [Planctomycetota bacterium]
MLPLALVCALFALACSPPARSGRPNIVILVSDDQDFEHFGFAGHPLVNAPTIDTLAAEGVRFDFCFVPMSRCRPAQAALLSGQWPHQSGVYYNVGATHIDPDASLANRLSAVGYRCFGEGKFWEFDPRLMGFENYTIRNYETFGRLGQAHLFEWLESLDPATPFFLWWAPELPHVPHDPPERFLDAIDPAAIPIPGYVAPDRVEEYRTLERKSLAMVSWLDETIAELRAELESLGLLDDTLFLFLVDNGWANGLPSKGTAFDKGLRTPAIFTWPEEIPGGSVHDELISAVDLYATLLDYGGATPLPSCMGRSLRPLIEGRPFTPREALFGGIYLQRPPDGWADPTRDLVALWARTKRYKYILYLQDVHEAEDARLHIQANACDYPERDRGDEDLFDLEADPEELNNLAGDPQLAAKKAELRQRVLEWWRETGGGDLSVPAD